MSPSPLCRSRALSPRNAIGTVAMIALALLLAASAAAQAPADIVLTGALIVDGSGEAPYLGDVRISGERIAAVGPAGSIATDGATVESLDGFVLAPGFIDIHNHSTDRFDNDPAATTQVAQGVTTAIVGADGGSPWPIGAYLDEIDGVRPAINVGATVGHGTVRREVMGDDFRREATDEEIARMAELVERGMSEGAFGLSTGLEYDPGFYSTTEELIDLSRVAARHGGFYMSHMRDEEEGVMDSIDEAIRIGVEAGLPIQISHIKMGNASVWGGATEALAKIAAARDDGLDITADQYPYTAWQSGLGIVVRSRRYTDPEAVAAGLEALGGSERLQIVNYPPDRSVEGMRLSEIAERDGKTDVDLYIEMMRAGGAGVIGHTMSEDDVAAFMTSPNVFTSSDGGIGSAHPRGAGAFARVLGYYHRELGLLTLERAVQRGTAQPARRLGLEDRGVIREGAIADLVAFDSRTVRDRSTFTEPLVTATGVHKTWVGGVAVWADGATTGERPGKILRPER